MIWVALLLIGVPAALGLIGLIGLHFLTKKLDNER